MSDAMIFFFLCLFFYNFCGAVHCQFNVLASFYKGLIRLSLTDFIKVKLEAAQQHEWHCPEVSTKTIFKLKLNCIVCWIQWAELLTLSDGRFQCSTSVCSSPIFNPSQVKMMWGVDYLAHIWGQWLGHEVYCKREHSHVVVNDFIKTVWFSSNNVNKQPKDYFEPWSDDSSKETWPHN